MPLRHHRHHSPEREPRDAQTRYWRIRAAVELVKGLEEHLCEIVR